MGSGVVTVGRRLYAVGLYWENSPSGRVAQAAKEAATQPGQQADFYALRAGNKDGRVPQFGLGQGAAGHKEGMPVFAACLANQQPGSYAGAFRLREGTVVTVVRDDLILPDGDQLFLNESDARDRLLQEISFGGLQRIYAPEAWSISGADSMPISLLMDERRDVTLRSVKFSKRLLIGAAVIGVLVLLAIGIGIFTEMQSESQPIKTATPVPIPFQPKAPDYPPPDRKWEKVAQPLDLIENCRKGLAKVPFVVAGWRLATLQCDGSAISLSWSRDKTSSLSPKGAIINESGTSATLSIPLPALTPRGPQDLADQSEITHRFLAQNWPGTVARMSDDPPPPPPPGYQGPWNPPLPPWVKRSFTLTVSELPSSLPAYFGDLPGVVVKTLTLSGGNGILGGSWTIEGVIYENRNESHN